MPGLSRFSDWSLGVWLVLVAILIVVGWKVCS
jgi:hypothetical protein